MLHVLVLFCLVRLSYGSADLDRSDGASLDMLQASDSSRNQQSLGGFWLMSDSALLYHFSHGQGEKVLFVHGGPGVPITDSLSALIHIDENWEFVYFHQRGCGQSSRPIQRFQTTDMNANRAELVNRFGLSRLTEDIEQIRGILGTEKLIIMGHSFGAFVATMYAVKYPDHVRGLILVSPAAVLTMPAENGGLFGLLPQYLPDSVKPAYQGFLGRYFNFFSHFSRSDSDLTALNYDFQQFYQKAAQARGFELPPDIGQKAIGGWAVQGCYMSMGMQYDLRPELKAITAPVLVIHGSNDIQPQSSSETYVKSFSHAKLEVINDAGHFPYLDQPETFSRIVREFLEQLK